MICRNLVGNIIQLYKEFNMFLLELFTLGNVFFIVAALILSILISECTDANQPFITTLLIVIPLGLFVYFGGYNPFKWVTDHPTEAAITVIEYFAIGAAWSIFKLWRWLTKIKNTVLKLQEQKKLNPYFDIKSRLSVKNLPTEFPVKISNYKSLILSWMIVWPASLIWTALNDPIRAIFEEIYNRLAGFMQHISDKITSDIDITSK